MNRRADTLGIVVHHSLSDVATVEMIRQWHIARGWNDIGYHYVVLQSGDIEVGRDIRLVGAHTYGRNKTHIGVCLEGNFHNYEPTIEQLNGCCKLYHDICRAYGKNLPVEFHRDRRLKNACPGQKLDRDDFLEIIYRATPWG